MYRKLRMTRLVLVLILLGLLFSWVGIALEYKKQSQAMLELVNGYNVCLNADNRTSNCMLEHDGEANTPADYGWYWK